MSPPFNHELLLFAEFLEYLRLQGFSIGTGQYLRLQELLDRISGECTPANLKTLLCPILATNKNQQELFYRAFDDYFTLFQPPAGEARSGGTAGKKQERIENGLNRKAGRNWVVDLILTLLLPLTLALGLFIIPKRPTPNVSQDSTSPALTPNTTTEPKNPSAGPHDSIERQIDSIAVLPLTHASTDPNVESLNDKITTNIIDALSRLPKLRVPPHSSVTTYRGKEVDPRTVGRNLGVRAVLTGKLAQQGEVIIIAVDLVHVADGFRLRGMRYERKLSDILAAPEDVSRDISNNIWKAVNIDAPPADPPLPPITGSRESFYQQHRNFVRLGMILTPFLIFLLYEWYRLNQRKQVIYQQRSKKPPLTWPLKIETSALPFYGSEKFYMAARHMRRRQIGEFHRLDVDATIAATVGSLGYPSFRYKPNSTLPEYLILIDSTVSRDHQAQLFATLARALEQEDIFLARFFYDGDPRVCRGEDGEGIHLAELHDKFSEHRLLIFGDGEKLLDPLTGRLAGWANIFLNWQDRALLTPEPPVQWGSREVTLAYRFVVMPATLDGLMALTDLFETTVPPDLRVWLRGADQTPIGELDDPKIVETLRNYLRTEGAFQWLCGCAVYPELQWDLTLYLGTLSCLGRDVVTEENLLRLVRLPWFRTGSMPDELRFSLIRELAPGSEVAIRSAIIDLLEKNPPPPEGSFAADTHKLYLAAQRWLSRRDRETPHQLLQFMKKLPQNLALRDHTLLRFLESAPSPLDLLVPRRLRKHFYQSSISGLGLKTTVRLLITLVIMAVAFAGTRSVDNKSSGGPNTGPVPPLGASPTPGPITVVGLTSSPNVSVSPSVSTTPNTSLTPVPSLSPAVNPATGDSIHFEPYLYLAGLTHEAALITWGAFFFRVKRTNDEREFRLLDDDRLKNVLGRKGTIGAMSEPYGPARVEVFDTAGKLITVAQVSGQNHAWARGLSPDTEYRYRVIVNGEEWAAGERYDWTLTPGGQGLAKSGRSYNNRFRTRPAPDRPSALTFGVIGSFGMGVQKPSTPNRRQREVAAALERAVDFFDVRFILTTGDDIIAKTFLGIPTSASGDQDDDWFFTFYQPYRYIINRVPIYTSFGKHDEPESEQSVDREQLFDNYYIGERFSSEEVSKDSSISNGVFYRFRYGADIEFISLDTTRSATGRRLFEDPINMAFINSAFPDDAHTEVNPPAWRIPFSHHPPYCAGPYRGNTMSMIGRLVPLFERAGVRAQFSGHENNFQYSLVGNINYFITGAAGKVRDSSPTRFVEAGTQAWGAGGHFLIVQINGDRMQVKPIGENGQGLPIYAPSGAPVATPIVVKR